MPMRLTFTCLLFILILSLPAPALAWNATGHEVVARIAWNTMTPAVRQRVIALLEAAPSDACLGRSAAGRRASARGAPTRVLRATRARGPTSCALARTTRGPAPGSTGGEWHYINYFWQGVSGATGTDRPTDRPDLTPPTSNVVAQLPLLRAFAACATPQCGTTDRRARHRARVDSAPGRRHAPAAAHERAHHIAAQRAEGRSGREPVRAPDRATVAPAARLLGQHRRSLGAEAATTSRSRRTSSGLPPAITRKHPRAAVLARLRPGDFEAWAREGFETAKASVYPATLEARRTARRGVPRPGLQNRRTGDRARRVPAGGSPEQDVRGLTGRGTGHPVSGRRERSHRLFCPYHGAARRIAPCGAAGVHGVDARSLAYKEAAGRRLPPVADHLSSKGSHVTEPSRHARDRHRGRPHRRRRIRPCTAARRPSGSPSLPATRTRTRCPRPRTRRGWSWPGATVGAPPADAIVLFDGTDLSKWEKEKGGGPAEWTVADGAMVVKPKTGGIRTKQGFGDVQLHIEWATPSPARGIRAGPRQQRRVLPEHVRGAGARLVRERDLLARVGGLGLQAVRPAGECEPQAGRVAGVRHRLSRAGVQCGRPRDEARHVHRVSQRRARPGSRGR